MSKQAVIYFKNGRKDWVDPVDEDSITYHEKLIIINNGFYDYHYFQEDVDRIEIIELEQGEDE